MIESETWPADEVTRKALSELVPYARTARTHTAGQIRQIAASMQEWGWTTPILVDDEGTIIAGHARVEAAKLLGIDQPKVSALMRGRLSGFSTERLIRFLNVLDRDVEIVVKPKPRSRRRGRIKVVAA